MQDLLLALIVTVALVSLVTQVSWMRPAWPAVDEAFLVLDPQSEYYPTRTGGYSELPFWLHTKHWDDAGVHAHQIGRCPDYASDHCLNALDYQSCFDDIYDDCINQTVYV